MGARLAGLRRASPKSEVPQERLYQPTAREAALLVLHLLGQREREAEREITRARLSDPTIRRLCGRTRLTNDFLFEIQEILLQAGWALFWAGSSYAVIKVSAVEGWARIASKWIRDDLQKVRRGRYDFDELENLLLTQDASSKDGEEKDD